MAKQDFYNIIDIKNKFDVITETLNIFDLSFLVSGSVMLGLCFFAFPIMRDFFIHGNHLFLSIVLCIWFSYVLGLICRTIGMNISKCFYNFEHCDKETNIKELYFSCFPKIFGKKNKLRLNIISYRKSRFCIFLYVDEIGHKQES